MVRFQQGGLKMIKSSYGCVRYARRVSHSNYTLLDLVVDFNNKLKSSKNTIEELSKKLGIPQSRLNNISKMLSLPNKKEEVLISNWLNL